MSKSKEVVTKENFEEKLIESVNQAVEITKELNSFAFSIVKDEKTLKYHIVKIPFNLETKSVGQLQVISEEESRDTANEAFKINVVKARIFG